MEDILRRQASLRAVIEHTVEALVSLLDTLDPDPDLEPSIHSDDREGDDCELHEGDGGCDVEGGEDEEESIGWPNQTGWGGDGYSACGRTLYGMQDAEGDEHDGSEPDDEHREYTTTEYVDQDNAAARFGVGWARDDDSEPSLGFCNNHGAGWLVDAINEHTADLEGEDEREDDHAERFGIADRDGLAQQGFGDHANLAIRAQMGERRC